MSIQPRFYDMDQRHTFPHTGRNLDSLDWMEERQSDLGVTSFFLSDSSPMIHYTSNSSAWTTGYALQKDGWDATVHLTSQSGSEIAFNITATSLTLLIPPFDNCTSTLSINSSDPIPACASPSSPVTLQNLPRGLHRVKYSTNTVSPGSEISFWGVDATRPYEADMRNVTVDAAPSGRGMRFGGEWTLQEGVSGAGNKTLMSTGKKGANFTFTGKGSAMYLYGNTGPGYSTASINLNGALADSLNFSYSWASTYQLLWFRTGLDPSTESRVTMTNLEDKRISLDLVVLTTTQADIDDLTKTSTPFLSILHGKIITFGLVPFLALVLLLIVSFLLIRHRRSRLPRRSKRSLTHHESAQNLRPLDFGDQISPYPYPFNKEDHEGYPFPAPRSVKSIGDELVVTYEEGVKRLSDRMKAQATSPVPPYSGSMETLPQNRAAYRIPSPLVSPVPLHQEAQTPSTGKERWSGLLRPIHHFLSSSSRPPLTSNPHETDMSRTVLSLPSAFGTPTSASMSAAEQAEYVKWSRATPQKGHLQPLRKKQDPPLFHSSLPLSPPRHPFAQRQRPSDAPTATTRTSTTPSDVVSVLAAPPSVRDMNLRLTHTGRSGPDRGFYPEEGDVPAVPNTDYAHGLVPAKAPPSAYVDSPRTGSARRKAPPRLSITDFPPPTPFSVPTFPPNSSPSAASPARPESALNGLASPTLEATSSAALAETRARRVSVTSRNSGNTVLSAARPDSGVIPFEEFVQGLKEGQRRVKEERERERGRGGRV